MNRRTFTKYLLAAPVALTTLLTSHLTSSLSPVKEKDEELGINCRTCKHKGTDFYYGLCPQNDAEADKLPQEKNYCFYYEELGQKEEEKLQWTWLRISGGDWEKSHDGINWTKIHFSKKYI